MNILYGVQGTGNGHISRARAMAKAFSSFPELNVDWIFSGRQPDQYFDMEGFGNPRYLRGMTFITENGKLRYLKTALRNAPLQFVKNCRNLDLRNYDLVISDYEPITAWAARKAGIPCIGLGHQYAFKHPVPRKGGNLVSNNIMRHFAPTPESLGLHWHHFNQPILPPIIDLEHTHRQTVREGKVLVYLPFEDNHHIIATLKSLEKSLSNLEFYVYSPGLTIEDNGNIHTRPPSRDGFKNDLADAQRVICNAGFELNSEALQLGKFLLNKPVAGQVEQISNGEALRQLGLATVIDDINPAAVEKWLKLEPVNKQINYPDVAKTIAQWIAEGRTTSIENLSEGLWQQTQGLPEWPQQTNY